MTALTVTRSVVFRCYDLPIYLGVRFEVAVEDGLITCDQAIADEMTAPAQARAWASLLLAAAEELEAGN